MPNNKKQSQTY